MPNPWLKKNPFMSLWLSTAHRMAGAVRGVVTAHARRQVSVAVTEATRDHVKLASGAVKPAATRAKRKR